MRAAGARSGPRARCDAHDPVQHCHVQRSKTRLVGREEAHRRTCERGRVEQHVLRRRPAADRVRPLRSSRRLSGTWMCGSPASRSGSARELNGEERVATGGAVDRGEGSRVAARDPSCVAQQPVGSMASPADIPRAASGARRTARWAAGLARLRAARRQDSDWLVRESAHRDRQRPRPTTHRATARRPAPRSTGCCRMPDCADHVEHRETERSRCPEARRRARPTTAPPRALAAAAVRARPRPHRTRARGGSDRPANDRPASACALRCVQHPPAGLARLGGSPASHRSVLPMPGSPDSSSPPPRDGSNSPRIAASSRSRPTTTEPALMWRLSHVAQHHERITKPSASLRPPAVELRTRQVALTGLHRHVAITGKVVKRGRCRSLRGSACRRNDPRSASLSLLQTRGCSDRVPATCLSVFRSSSSRRRTSPLISARPGTSHALESPPISRSCVEGRRVGVWRTVKVPPRSDASWTWPPRRFVVVTLAVPSDVSSADRRGMSTTSSSG